MIDPMTVMLNNIRWYAEREKLTPEEVGKLFDAGLAAKAVLNRADGEPPAASMQVPA